MKRTYDFLSLLAASLFSVLRVLLLSRPTPTKTLPNTRHSDAIILGNGPDLKRFLDDDIHFCQGKDLFCVNHFPETDYFEQLKPGYCVVNAAELWRDDVAEALIQNGKRLFESMAKKTTWPMVLFIQHEAKSFGQWQALVAPNKNIRIFYFNPTVVEGFERWKFWAFRHWLGMPRPHNVLIPALVFCINMDFKKIYITGADHSWMKDMYVAPDNTVYLTQKHFYDAQQAKAAVMHQAGHGARKMHEVLIKFYHAFAGYFVIDAYAKKKNIHIINLTVGSFIDAFDREQISANGHH